MKKVEWRLLNVIFLMLLAAGFWGFLKFVKKVSTFNAGLGAVIFFGVLLFPILPQLMQDVQQPVSDKRTPLTELFANLKTTIFTPARLLILFVITPILGALAGMLLTFWLGPQTPWIPIAAIVIFVLGIFVAFWTLK